MPWKTLIIIILAVLFTLFITLNVNNHTEISLVFFTLHAVPVYITVFVSMLIGALFMLPVLFKCRKSGRGRAKEKVLEDEIENNFQDVLKKSGNDLNGKTVKKRKKRKKNQIPEFEEQVSDMDILK